MIKLVPFVVWVGVIATAFAARLSVGVVPVGEAAAWLFAAFSPIALIVLLLRNTGTGSIAQLLYDVERDAADRRR